ncbi:hypothetical protein [Blastochloris tepida]|uniref:Uncharacterized protein n=1 Tax=Blastochloris tepida TaxID=2233851 RepID=A0A348G458_9HYPH|nr:hypothetical protein [Blastochloris tepida]BBF94341.1 hypothetical protein BLTE_30260 [Blastochloris tepida]
MDVAIEFAADIVDRFEEFLTENGISIPRHKQSNADMLPLWQILKQTKDGEGLRQTDNYNLFSAAVAVHDFASKILTIKDMPEFSNILPHLRMLSSGAVYLTSDPPASSDVYNKLIEVYWASLCLGKGINVSLDHPVHSTGVNPDVITLDSKGDAVHAYAFKTIRSKYTQSILDHIQRGVEQIEASSAGTGIVALHLTPRFQISSLFPEGYLFDRWECGVAYVAGAVRAMVTQVVCENGQSAIDNIFIKKKAVGAVLCLAFIPVVAKHPETGLNTFMPLKICVIVKLSSSVQLPMSLMGELYEINDAMQKFLG